MMKVGIKHIPSVHEQVLVDLRQRDSSREHWALVLRTLNDIGQCCQKMMTKVVFSAKPQ